MNLVKLGFILIFVGIILSIAVILIPILTVVFNIERIEDVSVGGCVLIFFIPICFGYGTTALHLLIIAIALALLVMIISLAMFIKTKKNFDKFKQKLI